MNRVKQAPAIKGKVEPLSGTAEGTPTTGAEVTVTAKLPILLNQPKPSNVPKNKRVVPVGTTNCWATLPVFRPSPIKKVCESRGESVEKSRDTAVLKAKPVGADGPTGVELSKNTPIKALAGANKDESPKLAGGV